MIFFGFPYPISRNAKGYFFSQKGLDLIKSNLLILLLTDPGERVMLPQYGTGLKKLLFEPNNVDLISTAKQMIINAIEKWEPRISLEQIDISTDITGSLSPADDNGQDRNILMIRIKFIDTTDIQNLQELNLSLPIGSS